LTFYHYPKILEFKNRELKNFFSDYRQKQTKDLTFEDREQAWWWKNAVIARNVWFYRDRLSTVRGPCTLPVLREAWAKGIIDDKTLVWGNGLIDWIPIRNVNLLTSAIRTPEVQITSWIKKKLSFEGKLELIRKERENFRILYSNQMDLWS
jgi:hypothetical protein